MRVKILRAFPFSRDGVTPLTAEMGAIEDIPDALVPGLKAERFVDLLSPEVAQERAVAAAPAETREGVPPAPVAAPAEPVAPVVPAAAPVATPAAKHGKPRRSGRR